MMAEKLALSGQETPNDEAREGLDELLALQHIEEVTGYPKTSEEVRKELQQVATVLQNEINGTRSSSEQNNDKRGNFIVKQDTNTYCYIMESFGINTKFKFIPTGKKEEGKLVLYYGLENFEYMEVEIDSWKDASTIKKFLGWVNSANKEIALCNEYNFLENLPDLLKNNANKKYYNGYYERYIKIMNESSFAGLTFEPSSIGSRPIIDLKGRKDAFMDARWEAIKKRAKPTLQKLFAERGFKDLE